MNVKQAKSDISVTNKQMIAFMLRILKAEDKGLIGMCLSYTFFTSIYPLFAVYLPGLLIKEIEGAATLDAVLPTIALILALYFVFAGVFGYMSRYLGNSSYARISYLRMTVMKHTISKVMTMDFVHYEDASFLDRTNRVNRGMQSNDRGIELVYRNIFMMPATVISVLLMLAVLAGAHPLLVVLPLVLFALMIWSQNRTDAYIFSRREESSRQERQLYHYNDLAQNFTYGKDVRLYSLEGQIFSSYNKMIDLVLALREVFAKRRFKDQLLPLLARVVSMAVTLIILVRLALTSVISIAEFSIYLSAYVSMSLLLDELSANIVQTMSEARFVKEAIFFLEEDLNTNSGGVILSPSDLVEIEFRDVSFTYPGSEVAVFEHLNFKLRAGEKLALVGINGAGKSTIVKLMTGLHHPTGGQVLVNGVDTKTLDPKALFKQFSVVFQDEEALSFTVAEHVAGSLTDINREKLEAVLRKMGLWEKIASHEDGMDRTLLKVIDPDGLMLSGGESQKLMLARAAYKDAPVMVLDEPTSALDALAETKVYEEFSGAMEGKTSLFISHRLASTSFCDRIVLLSAGTILEEGTHQELMAMRGQYYEMFMTQGKYYQQEAMVHV